MIRQALFYLSSIALVIFLLPFISLLACLPVTALYQPILIADAFYEAWAAIHFDFNWFGNYGPVAVFVLLVLLLVASSDFAD